MKLGSAKAWAKTLGTGLAHVQNAIDRLAEYSFAKLKEAGSNPKKSPPPKNPYVRGATKALGTASRFVGYLGDSYFREYEKLKRKG